MAFEAYIYDGIADFSDTDLDTALARVSSARRAKALSYVPTRHRKLSVIAELMLRHAVAMRYGRGILSRMPDFEKIALGAGGKPYFPDSALHFNISHCDKAVACVVGDSEVGIDVECHAACDAEIAHRVLCGDELREVQSSVNPAAEFARLWTMKESLLKYSGLGLTDHLTDILADADGVRFASEQSAIGYTCTVCHGTEISADVRFIHLTKDSLCQWQRHHEPVVRLINA